mmetsp:Transcript_59842/g.134946  ORF Transcript_59842/g.134946 Transcript_59842/m.134946 type:complete len:404 (-) Transcript_59842:767-1978(-)
MLWVDPELADRSCEEMVVRVPHADGNGPAALQLRECVVSPCIVFLAQQLPVQVDLEGLGCLGNVDDVPVCQFVQEKPGGWDETLHVALAGAHIPSNTVSHDMDTITAAGSLAIDVLRNDVARRAVCQNPCAEGEAQALCANWGHAREVSTVCGKRVLLDNLEVVLVWHAQHRRVDRQGHCLCGHTPRGSCRGHGVLSYDEVSHAVVRDLPAGQHVLQLRDLLATGGAYELPDREIRVNRVLDCGSGECRNLSQGRSHTHNLFDLPLCQRPGSVGELSNLQAGVAHRQQASAVCDGSRQGDVAGLDAVPVEAGDGFAAKTVSAHRDSLVRHLPEWWTGHTGRRHLEGRAHQTKILWVEAEVGSAKLQLIRVLPAPTGLAVRFAQCTLKKHTAIQRISPSHNPGR